MEQTRRLRSVRVAELVELVARLCGVKVLRFSVGFGRPLIIRRLGKDQTEWVLAAFPLGGYVKMLDEREGEVASAELPRAFARYVASLRPEDRPGDARAVLEKRLSSGEAFSSKEDAQKLLDELKRG